MSTSNSTEQNGRPPTQKTTPPTDPRIRNVTAPDFCRDYVWGICHRGAQCNHPHVRNFELMKRILIFCHDYQNNSKCVRPGCTYLHATRDEEKLFLNTGQIPRALSERYMAMSSPMNCAVNMSEGMAQNMLYMGEFLHQPPPPPPASLAPPATATMQPSMPLVGAAMQPAMTRPPLPPLPTLLAPPPPPPPPTETTTSVNMTAPKYSTTSTIKQAGLMCPINTPTMPPLSLPDNFDATKPPPPLPVHPNGAQKRAADPFEAGPSKARKADIAKGIELCESCVQRKLRFELYRQEIKKSQYEKEYKTLLHEKKVEDYENGRLLLRSLVNPELYQILDEYVERVTAPLPAQNILSQLGNSFGLGHSSVSTEDCLLSSLSAASRSRASAIHDTSPDLLQSVLGLIRTTATTSVSERGAISEVAEARQSATINTSAMNGLHSMLNGPRAEQVARVERAALEAAAPRLAACVGGASAAGPPAPAPAAHPAPVAPAAPGSYLPYHPAVPPSAPRPFFAQPYPSTAVHNTGTNTSFNPTARMGVPQSASRLNLAVTVPNTPNYNPYMLGQFPPQPPYYPPYQ